MDHYISREKTIEAIKTDLSQFVYDEYGNMTALGGASNTSHWQHNRV